MLGKTLMGLPVASMVAGNPPSKVMVYFWTTGFIIDAIGGFLGHLFSADRSDVRRMFEDSEEDTKIMLRGKVDVDKKKK